MAKDPAVLLYFDKWIAATNGMRADFRAWYMDLMIYQYDKGYVPSDIDELYGICRVRPSEYDMFKQMLEQVLKQKFKQMDNGTYQNDVVCEVMRKREQFLEKRVKSGTIGSIIKSAKTIKGFTTKHLDRLKSELYAMDDETLKKHMDKQVLEHLLKLYVNVNEDVDVIVNKDKGSNGKNPTIEQVVEFFKECGYSEAYGKEAWQYYEDGNWHDKNGNKVLNWKQKMRQVWMKKPPQEIQQTPSSGKKYTSFGVEIAPI